MAEVSFKERVRQEIIKGAKQYKKIYLDYEYLICSTIFEKKDYYIISAEKDNYQHLTGVHSQMDAKSFFNKCYDGTLAEADFDFATADGNCTLGFSESKKARPKSLIKGNELQNPGTVDLIMRRTTGSLYFDEIVVGDTETLNQFKEKIEKMVSADLFIKDENRKLDYHMEEIDF